MAITEKGKNALQIAIKFFPVEKFSAAELSEKSNEKIFAATLNSLVNNGYMNKIAGTPVKFFLAMKPEEIIESLKTESVKQSNNKNLREAKKVKNDEFYTRYEDIEAEVMKYRKELKDKIIYLPCDDPINKKSEFWNFFVNNFDAFGLKELIATHYDGNGNAYKYWINGDKTGDGYIDEIDAYRENLQGNGDFRSPECINILEKSDIVITNPPFSLFREFIAWILNKNKKFLIIGNQNAFTYKEIFPLIKDNILWTGYNAVHNFYQPDGSIKKFGNICWFTNLLTKKRNEEIILTKTYNSIDYPKYDNYDAIEVSKVVNIPKDYFGIMGVPVTFLMKYNPNQFKIIGGFNGYKEPDYKNGLICGSITEYIDNKTGEIKQWTGPTINKKTKYYRILIQKKNL